jgi:hypothetical protein
MFIETLDRTTLRQGDVIRDVVFPLARFETTRFLGRATRREDGAVGLDPVIEGSPERPYQIIQVQGTVGFAAVLSQCCDVDARQNPPPHTFVLCRVVPVPKGIIRKQSSHQALKSNLDPYGEQRAFLGAFWFGTLAAAGQELMADFAQVVTMPWVDYDQILLRKIAQLDDISRAKFRVKVGAHFGRVSQEDQAAGLEDPYALSTAEDERAALHPSDVAEPSPLSSDEVSG